jgi:predicted alpha/beta hydrolase family esterase
MTTNTDIRVLIIPGLHNSGDAHWQSWLQTQYRGAVRVKQQRWDHPDLLAWSARIDEALAKAPALTQWVAVAHSFGCLALARWATASPQRTRQVQGGLLVAPANPARFGVAASSLDAPMPFPATLVTSRNDPWFDESGARTLGRRWRATLVDAGAQGHLNADSGHGPWPLAQDLLDELVSRKAAAAPPAASVGGTLRYSV